jgi:hypothetical protein
MRLLSFIPTLAILALAGCGKFQVLDAWAHPEAAGEKLLERELTVMRTGEPIPTEKQVVAFSKEDVGRQLRLRLHFKTTEVDTSLSINKTTVVCSDVVSVQLLGPGREENQSLNGKQELAANSEYALEYVVRPNCETARFTPEVWLGTKGIEPDRYYRCNRGLRVRMVTGEMRVFQEDEVYLGNKTFCGRQLPQIEFGGGGSGDVRVAGARACKLTAIANHDGAKYEATAVMNFAAKTLDLSCAKDGSTFYGERFGQCEQVIENHREVR